MPPTTGGSTIGSSVSARTTPRPGYATRACTHASGTPSTTAIAVAASDVSIDSRSATSDSCSDSTDHADVHGARHSRPARGTTKMAAATTAPASTTAGTRSRRAAVRCIVSLRLRTAAVEKRVQEAVDGERLLPAPAGEGEIEALAVGRGGDRPDQWIEMRDLSLHEGLRRLLGPREQCELHEELGPHVADVRDRRVEPAAQRGAAAARDADDGALRTARFVCPRRTPRCTRRS